MKVVQNKRDAMFFIPTYKEIVFVVLVLLLCGKYVAAVEPKPEKIRQGMTKQELFALYSMQDERTYRVNNHETWVTFDERSETNSRQMITFHLVDDKVADWHMNNRPEVIIEYLSEFCSQVFIQVYPKIYAALRAVLEKLPSEVFYELTDRANPVLFTEYYTQGVGRFANSADITFLKDDPPTFTRGIRIVKFSTELNQASTVGEIEGVVAHELAHRFLKHAGAEGHSAASVEKQANDIARQWGFTEEVKKAQKRFHH